MTTLFSVRKGNMHVHDLMVVRAFHPINKYDFDYYNEDNWTFAEFTDFLDTYGLNVKYVVVLDGCGLNKNGIYYVDYNSGKYSEYCLKLSRDFFLAPIGTKTLIQTFREERDVEIRVDVNENFKNQKCTCDILKPDQILLWSGFLILESAIGKG